MLQVCSSIFVLFTKQIADSYYHAKVNAKQQAELMKYLSVNSKRFGFLKQWFL